MTEGGEGLGTEDTRGKNCEGIKLSLLYDGEMVEVSANVELACEDILYTQSFDKIKLYACALRARTSTSTLPTLLAETENGFETV